MTRDFFAKIEGEIKRPLSERERAEIGGLVLADRLPKNHRKRKRSLRRVRLVSQRTPRDVLPDSPCTTPGSPLVSPGFAGWSGAGRSRPSHGRPALESARGRFRRVCRQPAEDSRPETGAHTSTDLQNSTRIYANPMQGPGAAVQRGVSSVSQLILSVSAATCLIAGSVAFS